MRTYKPVLCIVGVQVKQTLFLVDCLSVGAPLNLFQDRSLLKITSEVTQTGTSYERVVEVNSPLTCCEDIFTGLDFRSRPIARETVAQIRQDFEAIKSSFYSNPHTTIKDRCASKNEQFGRTTFGRLLQLRD